MRLETFQNESKINRSHRLSTLQRQRTNTIHETDYYMTKIYKTAPVDLENITNNITNLRV